MDNNNPQNPNSPNPFPPQIPPQSTGDASQPQFENPAPPAESASGFGQSPAPSLTDPAGAPWQTPSSPTTPQPTALPGSDQTQATPTPTNPWDNLSQNSLTQSPPAAGSDGFPPLPTAPDPTAAPVQGETANPMASNPFLQTQPPASGQTGGFGQTLPTPPTNLEQLGINQPPVEPAQSMPSNSAQAAAPFPGVENPQPPVAPAPQDPLNTAFSPGTGSSEPNPFAMPENSAPDAPPPQEPIQPTNQAVTTPPQPQNPVVDMALDTIPAAEETPQNPAVPVADQPIPAGSQPGALDLSSLQANTQPPVEPGNQPTGTPLPEMGPVENAPTDLSHLIAGDEGHQQPGEIYNPPVAVDQNPTVNPTPAQAGADEETPPQEKHLNLTKVLLIAGIPIILIIGALSAYLFLGVGKSTPQTENTTTSLPVEQGKTDQAPLTNPPQQITAPSPVVIPEPQTQVGVLPNDSSASGVALPTASSSPAASLSPAMQAAQKAASPSPATSPSTTLP